jgi:hypothetical protein
MTQGEAKRVADSMVQATDSAPDDSVSRPMSASVSMTVKGDQSVKLATPAEIEAT